MKKRFALFTALLLSAVCLTAVAQAADVNIDLEVREKMFLTQITELMTNTPDYLGKTIALEGMFTSGTYGEGDALTYHLVYRRSPGCCGNDGITGLEVLWDDPAAVYPAENDWVRAVGTLEQYEEDDISYLRLRLLSLTVLPERGQEFISQ